MDRLAQLQAKHGPESLLRVRVDGGGCSGFMYTFKLDTEVLDDDRVVEQEGTRYVVIDEMSLDLIKGSKVEYEQELIKQGFVIKDNPQAEQSCGCDMSFALKT